MYPELLIHIKRYVSLTPAEEQLLCNHIQPVSLKKKAFLLGPGKVCPGNYFIVKGCMRLYFINNKLNEHIIQFGIENWWISDADSLLNGKPSNCYLQAIEASELLILPAKKQAMLFEAIPRLESYFRIMIQIVYVAAQRRIGFIFNQTEEERYRSFVSQFPGFAQRVPQYMIASYLGLTPQYISRLRAKTSL
jgi:CRP/FNR family transcriptional regulator